MQQRRITTVPHGSRIHGLSRLKQLCQFENNKYRHGAYRDPKAFTANCNSNSRDITQLIDTSK